MTDENLHEDESLYETTPLTLETVDYIAARSGKSDQELRVMLLMLDLQGKSTSVRYKVVAKADTPIEQPKKKFWQRSKK